MPKVVYMTHISACIQTIEESCTMACITSKFGGTIGSLAYYDDSDLPLVSAPAEARRELMLLRTVRLKS